MPGRLGDDAIRFGGHQLTGLSPVSRAREFIAMFISQSGWIGTGLLPVVRCAD